MRAVTIALLLSAAAAFTSSAALAEVVTRSDAGFVLRHVAEVSAAPAAVWSALDRPDRWWESAHTYSGTAANLKLEPRAGGCFCETVPASGATIEHMRVLYANPGKTLRLSGALGPLQSEALTATLTISLTPSGKGTRIEWVYVVGGYMRQPGDKLVPVVDRVLGAQVQSLAAYLSGQR